MLTIFNESLNTTGLASHQMVRMFWLAGVAPGCIDFRIESRYNLAPHYPHCARDECHLSLVLSLRTWRSELNHRESFEIMNNLPINSVCISFFVGTRYPWRSSKPNSETAAFGVLLLNSSTATANFGVRIQQVIL